MVTEPENPWQAIHFREHRKHLSDFVEKKILPCLEELPSNHVVVRAPVKSGKRQMVEFISVILSDYHHCFVSAFHRKADERQREEMHKYNIKVFSRLSEKCADDLQAFAETALNSKPIMIHLDECDYGSGDDQGLSKVWEWAKDNPAIKIILYSATPSETHVGIVEKFPGSSLLPLEYANVSSNGDMVVTCISYEPPPEFNGPKKFLKENLVEDATPFFNDRTYKLTEQGDKIWSEFIENFKINPKRGVFVLRLCGGKKLEDKPFDKFIRNIDIIEDLHKYGEIVVRVATSNPEKFKGLISKKVSLHLDEEIKWSYRRYWDDNVNTNKPTLIVLDQTSTRSTEWKCHDRVYAYHDFRKTINFSVLSQAQERVNHYIGSDYSEFQPIKVYGSKKVWELSAGLINYTQFMNGEWRMRKINNTEPPYFKIHKSNDTSQRHSQYSGNYSEEEALEILAILGCGITEKPKLSSRLGGHIKEDIIIMSKFIPCGPQTFHQAKTQVPEWVGRGMRNPFTDKNNINEDGTFNGYIRGKKKPFSNDEIEADRRWGINKKSTKRCTICYDNGVLGVNIRWITEDSETINNLKTNSSMYGVERSP